MRTVVITSISAVSDLDHHLRCLRAWHELGFIVRTANTEQDTKTVIAAGVPAAMTVAVPPRQTALDASGAPAPTVLPLLAWAQAQYPGHPVLLTSPGIYPALQDSTCIARWQDMAPALALTVETCGLIDGYRYSDSAPDRSVPGAIWLSADKIAPLAEALGQWPVSADMCLGSPGANLLMTALIRDPALGGLIMDSGMLLREGAAQETPAEAALTPYVPALRALGLADAPDAVSALEDCTRLITQACEKTAERTARLKAYHFEPPRSIEIAEDIIQLVTELQQMIPWVRWNYDLPLLAALARRIRARGGLRFDRIAAILNSGPSQSQQISEALLALVLWARLRPNMATALRDTYAGIPALAETHEQSLFQLHRNYETHRDLSALRLGLIQLAGRGIIDHGVWTAALRDAMALSCQNPGDRTLFDQLTAATKEVADAA